MKISIDLRWQEYRYFPYEKHLAKREAEALLGIKPENQRGVLCASVSRFVPEVLERLTYFREVRLNGTSTLVPVQARLEASAIRRRLSSANLELFSEEPLSLTRQSTRYSAHGLHEYRGKFNPQIVRAIGNILELPKGAWVLDPFCGSGTSLLECAHIGWNAIGIDLNPLGVFIANAKLQALRIPSRVLGEQVRELVQRLAARTRDLNFAKPFTASDYGTIRAPKGFTLPNREYLERWFAPSVLAQLECIESEIRRLSHPHVQDIARVVLSDGLRAASYQDPGDLRIRRRKDPRPNYPAIPSFVTTLIQRTETILRAKEVIDDVQGVQCAILGDSRQAVSVNVAQTIGHQPTFDCVITSPPYATALPYIDTQRLSLAFLGLVTCQELRDLEKVLIGNREITSRERDLEEQQIDTAAGLLPRQVIRLCRMLSELALRSGNGFRRRNVPALLLRYFRDMRNVFDSVLPVVRRGGAFALVVGPNRTTLAGREITIDTPRLLAEVAEHAGWQVREVIALDAYPRFDVHRKNSITREALIIVERGA